MTKTNFKTLIEKSQKIVSLSDRRFFLLKAQTQIKQEAMLKMGDVESAINEEIKLITEQERLTMSAEPPLVETRYPQKITTELCLLILKRCGITTATYDATKIARLISAVTGYSANSIRKRLSTSEGLFSSPETDEIHNVLKSLNINEKLTID